MMALHLTPPPPDAAFLRRPVPLSQIPVGVGAFARGLFSRSVLGPTTLRWYADDTELQTPESEVRNVQVFGGFALTPAEERKLRERIEDDVKRPYHSHANFPLKWNFQNLRKRYCDRPGYEALFERLLADSRTWRRRVFEILAEHDVRILVACCVGEAKRPEDVSEKDFVKTLRRDAFVFGLQRLALHAQQSGKTQAEVVLDWPSDGERRMFDDEYANAHCTGKTRETGWTYLAGALRKSGFHDAPFYSSMIRSTSLQVADLIVGATRDFLGSAIRQTEPGFGTEMLQLVRSRFVGAPDRIPTHGLVVAPPRSKERQRVEEAIVQHLVVG